MSWVLFYDGSCGMCSGIASWLARHDRQGVIRLVTLDGAEAQAAGVTADPDSLVLLEVGGRRFTRSDGVLQLADLLGWPWRVLTIGRWIPRPARDWMYDRIAANRHRLTRGMVGCSVAPGASGPHRRPQEGIEK